MDPVRLGDARRDEVFVAPLGQHSGAGRTASSWRRDADDAAAADEVVRNGSGRALSRRSRSSFLQSASLEARSRPRTAGSPPSPPLASSLLRRPAPRASPRPHPRPRPQEEVTWGGARGQAAPQREPARLSPHSPASRRGASRLQRGPAGSGWRRRRLRPLHPGMGVIVPECRALSRSTGGHEVGGGAETREEETPQGSSSADTRCVLSPERPAGTSRCRGCHSHLSRGSHLAGWGRGRTSAESPPARVEAGPSYSSCPMSPVAPPRDPPH